MDTVREASQHPAEEEKTVSLYVAHQTVYARAVKGLFIRWRWAFVWLTQIVFYGLPWLEWGGRQAVLFDLGARRFYILGLVLYPQDFIYLTALLLLSAYGLFLFTAVAGRLWCGYACPQTVYTELFMAVERRFEGDRNARIRLDAAPWGLEKIARKGGKQFAWIAMALWTGFTFVGYFSPIRQLMGSVASWSLGPWETFWIGFYSFATWGNAGYMREQVCKYMCPYARFQSAMFDKDTLIITYDTGRGEPRGPRARKRDETAPRQGDCVDCGLCVQVCPTGIDIRRGLQYECIGCAACVDACDGVMDKLGMPKGLVRYSTQNAMANGWGWSQLFRRVLRPRIAVYTTLLFVIAGAVAFSLASRVPFRVDVVRDRASLGRLDEDGYVENVYRLQIMNATEKVQTFSISATGLPGLEVKAKDTRPSLGPAEARWVPVALRLPPTEAARLKGLQPVRFVIDGRVQGSDDSRQVAEKTTFAVPR